MPEACLNVDQTVMLVGRRAQRLGQQRVSRSTRSVSSPRRERSAVPSTPIRSPRSRSSSDCHPLGPELVDPGLQLDPPGAVDEVKEGHLALTAPRREPPRDAVRRRSSPPRPQAPHGQHGPSAIGSTRVELVRERLDAGGAQAVELLAPRGEDVLVLVRRRSRALRPQATSIFVILSLRSPLGVAKAT